ncbi:TraB/GumN family protein [Massilia sp. BJB1822]|uniref:TraB/GumN family protein n=1 Tax=Massilia sp. BJB1822 TaxID=2744470 RepID=UPI001E3F11E4|nr:TraB/GumN family protein [Massilia sp. BJB1822]
MTRTKRSMIPVLVLCLLAGSSWAQTETAIPEAASEAEKILIVGQRPGPGMWRVSKDDHVLWVFAKYGPLPLKMEWRSHEVEAVLAKSQEYLPSPTSHASTGVWGTIKLVTALPSIWNMQNNPNGATLREVVPAESYERWLALKEKYMAGDKEVERYRPIFAASSLFEHGLKQIGLSNKEQVLPTIDKLVKQYKLKVTPSSVNVDMSDASKLLKDFSKSTLEDGSCFATTLAQLETDIDNMRLRANAWATGDIELIRQLNFADREGTCRAAVEASTAFQSRPDLLEMRAKSRDIWIANAEKALESNTSTFAVLTMQDVLSPTGLIARLQAKGYKVEAPE